MKLSVSHVLFLQAFHALCGTLHGGHLFRTFHAFPLADIVLGKL
ncbi:Unknown protein sequence [Pseudomonas amygdali pv. morsprunorum]|nr:Unknown protein sequence [Pseudomonas amygdali pv. morsprunorum]